MSTPPATWSRACPAFPASAATSMPRSCALAMTSGGGGPSAFAMRRAGWASATSTCLRANRVQPAHDAVAGLRAVRQRWHAEFAQGAVDEVPVCLGDHRVEVPDGPFGGHPGRHDHVDAVRPPAGIRVHPVQDGVQLGRVVEPHAAEHAPGRRPG